MCEVILLILKLLENLLLEMLWTLLGILFMFVDKFP